MTDESQPKSQVHTFPVENGEMRVIRDPKTGRLLGGSGGPGRPPGSRNKATLMAQAMIDQNGNKVIDKLIESANKGEPYAVKLVVERLVPPRKVAPFKINLPPVHDLETAKTAIAYILEQQCQGEITSDEAEGLMKTVEGIIKISQIAELEQRVDRLEIIRTVIDGKAREQS